MSYLKFDTETIDMGDMKPLQVGRVVGTENYNGHVVMRTANSDTFEVMDLTLMEEDSCWVNRTDIQVQLLMPDEVINMVLCNETKQS